jgi:hypothetical protein
MLVLFVAFLSVAVQKATGQVVSPLQSGHYAPGVTNVRDMAQPPPGLFVIWYNLFISTDSYYDRDGNELNTLALSQIDPALPDVDFKVDLNAFATVPALFWASSFSVLGGRYMVGISPNYTTANGTIVSEVGLVDTTITEVEEGSVSGISDLFVVPAGLSWGFKQSDITLTYGFYAPTGKYTTGADDNVGLGFWTHQFQGYGYYYPFPSRATALMVGLTYELTSKIEDRDMNPGNRFTLEWGLSQYLSERFEVGVQGGHNWQISDDSGKDVFWDSSFRDRKSTVAFSAGYWPWQNRLYLSVKYAFDFGIRQRFKNKYWMINLIFLTNALTGSS